MIFSKPFCAIGLWNNSYAVSFWFSAVSCSVSHWWIKCHHVLWHFLSRTCDWTLVFVSSFPGDDAALTWPPGRENKGSICRCCLPWLRERCLHYCMWYTVPVWGWIRFHLLRRPCLNWPHAQQQCVEPSPGGEPCSPQSSLPAGPSWEAAGSM